MANWKLLFLFSKDGEWKWLSGMWAFALQTHKARGGGSYAFSLLSDAEFSGIKSHRNTSVCYLLHALPAHWKTNNICDKDFPLVSIHHSCKSEFVLLQIVAASHALFFLLGFHELLQWWSRALAAGISFVTKSFVFQLHFLTHPMPWTHWWWKAHGMVALGLGVQRCEMLRQEEDWRWFGGTEETFYLMQLVFFKVKKEQARYWNLLPCTWFH